MIDERRLGEFSNYDELLGVVKARMIEVGITNDTLELITGLPDRYVAKLLSKSKNLGPMSFGVIVQGLGMKLAAFEGPAATQKMRTRRKHRKKAAPIAKPLSSTTIIPDYNGFMRRLGRRGGKARTAKLSPTKRRRIARLGWLARWQREKERHRCKAAARPA